MSEEYTPTTAKVACCYVAGRLSLDARDASLAGLPGLDAEFDRWLAGYRREVLSAEPTKAEVEAAARAIDALDYQQVAEAQSGTVREVIQATNDSIMGVNRRLWRVLRSRSRNNRPTKQIEGGSFE